MSVEFNLLTSHVKVFDGDLIIVLYGRNETGSVRATLAAQPYIIMSDIPSDLEEKLSRYCASRRCEKFPKFNVEKAVFDRKPLDVTPLTGQNIVRPCSSTFNKINLDIYTYWNLRRMLREPVPLIYQDHEDTTNKWLRDEGTHTVRMFQLSANVFNDQVGLDLQFLIDHEIMYGDTVQVANGVLSKVDGVNVGFLSLSYDLECNLRTVNGKLVFPSSKCDPIITIGIALETGVVTEKHVFCLGETPPIDGTQVYWFPTEHEMLIAFNNFVVRKDPDFILGHNVNRFDNVYYRDRCQLLGVPFTWSREDGYLCTVREVVTQSNQRGTQEVFRLDIPGRIVLDTYEKFRADYKLRSYKLNSLGEHFLKQSKVDLPYAQIPVKFQTAMGRRELAIYCVQDSHLVLELVRTQNKIVNVIAMANVTGISPKDILQRGQGIRTVSLMIRYGNVSQPRLFIPHGTGAPDGFKGAVVLEPHRGKYDDAVICVDFASLYPSIMQAMNMSYETLVSNDDIVSNGWVEGVDVRTVPDYSYVDGRLITTHNTSNCSFLTTSVREGILPQILRELLAERKRVKGLMVHGDPMYQILNGKQLALKVTANSIYGFTGAKHGYLPEPRIASSVTKYGRGLTLRTMDIVDNNPEWLGSKVIYGDSVTGDTPVIVCVNGLLQIRPISQLSQFGTSWNLDKSGKESSELNIEVWSDLGWTNVSRVIRHRTQSTIVRVVTLGGTVDVTSDHSLLRPNGTEAKPCDIGVGERLMHRTPPCIEINVDWSYDDAFAMGVYMTTGKDLGVQRHLFHPDGCKHRVVPRLMLLAPRKVKLGFYNGMTDRSLDRRIETINKEAMAGIHYICHCLDINAGVRNRYSGFRLTMYESKRGDKITQMEELGPTDDYVYDLTTSNHHFHAGVGSIIVHNTDSCFIHLSRAICDGPDSEALISRAHEVGEMMANEITKEFLPPVLMEYESAFQPPFLLLKKKRYIGNLCLPGQKPKPYIKGCECVRRDFAPIVVKTQRKMISLLLEDNISGAIQLIQNTFDDLFAGRIALQDLTLSKKLTQLPENYRSKMAHVELAKRLKRDRPDKAPVAGDRVEYVIRAGFEELYMRAILPDEVDKYVIDYNYYANKQLRKPLERIMELVTDTNIFHERRVTAPLTNVGIIKFLKRKHVVKSTYTTTIATTSLKKAKLVDIRKFFS